MAKIPKKAFMDKYWICQKCADVKEWKLTKDGITVISGYCGHCRDHQLRTLIPIVDFKRGKVESWFD